MIDNKDTRFFFDDYGRFLTECARYLSGLLRKYFVSVFVITLLFGGAGFAYWYSMKPYYEANMVCGYNNARLSRKNYGEMFEKLDILAKSKSYNELSKLLQLPVEQTSMLMGFEAKNMLGSPLQEDITGVYQSMYFTVRATGRNVFEPLQPALINYLSNGPYQHEIGQIEIAKINRIIAGQQQVIAQADSTIAAYTLSVRNSGRADSAGFESVAALLAYKDRLQEKLAGMEQKKALEESVSVLVIHGFTPGDAPVRGNKKIILAALLAGLFIGCCQALWREAKQRN